MTTVSTSTTATTTMMTTRFDFVVRFLRCCFFPSSSSSYFSLLNIIIKSSLHRYSISNDNDGGDSNSRGGGGNKCGQIFTLSNALGCVLHSINVCICVLFVLLSPQSIRSLNATSTISQQLANHFSSYFTFTKNSSGSIKSLLCRYGYFHSEKL